MGSESIKGDGLEFCLPLQSSLALFKKELWETELKKTVYLNEGDNLFWIEASKVDDLISGNIELTIGKSSLPVRVVCDNKLTETGAVSDLLHDHIEHVFEYMKVLRIIDSDE